MNLPKEFELALFVVALIVVAIRLWFGIRAYSSRRNIFSSDRRISKASIAANIGYAVVALLLGFYFLFSYQGKKATMLVFELALFALLAVLIIEAMLKKH